MADTLVTGNDSYVSLEEANSYISLYKQSASPEATSWKALSDEDKCASLRASCQSIDKAFAKDFNGARAVSGQKLEFPRSARSTPGIIYIPFIGQRADTSLLDGSVANDGLADVKVAQMENAFDGIVLGTSFVKDVNARTVAGILSKKVGSSSGMAETYSDGNNVTTADMLTGIYNPRKIRALLVTWLTSSIHSM